MKFRIMSLDLVMLSLSVHAAESLDLFLVKTSTSENAETEFTAFISSVRNLKITAAWFLFIAVIMFNLFICVSVTKMSRYCFNETLKVINGCRSTAD